MRSLGLGNGAFGIVFAIGALAGCGDPQALTEGSGAMPQRPAQTDVVQHLGPGKVDSVESTRTEITARADHGMSWMAAAAAMQDLLYVTDEGTVLVYSYPRGKVVGTLKGFFIASGACVDKKGDVYIADQGRGRVYEYEHGGKKRIKTLDPGDALGCSVDPSTGNLAVTNLEGGPKGNGNVAIFKNARSSPTYYSAPGFGEYFFCGYDDKGNLFVDGLSRGSNFVLAELPKGSDTFTKINLNQYIGFPGGVQWDGKHLAIGDQTTNVYEFSITGNQATLVGKTQMGGARYVKQFWIQGRTLIAPNSVSGSGADVLFYKYPAGGAAIEQIRKGIRGPQGATVSLAEAS